MAFFDEISTAPPAVQAALLRVVLERTVGDLELPDGVSVVAAANPPDQAADGWDLSAPLANRFCHLDWPLDAARARRRLRRRLAVRAPPHARRRTGRPGAGGPQLGGGASCVSAAELALAVPDDLAAAGRAWPSPRSWDMAATLLAAARSTRAEDAVASALVSGCVGPGAAVEFLTWLAEADLPDPEAVLADPEHFVLPTRGDRAYAVLSSVAAAVAADTRGDRWERGWRAFGHAADAAPDVAAAAARTLARCRPRGRALPPEIDLFLPVAA